MTRIDFYQAAIPDGWQILGAQLRPFSVGHLILLNRVGCRFVAGEQPGFDDLIFGLMICQRTFEEGLSLICSGETESEIKKFDDALKECDAPAEVLFQFALYLSEGMAGPKVWSKGEGKRLGSPPEQTVKVAMMGELGLSESEALNRAYSLCLWDMAALSELRGLTQVYGKEDETLEEQKRELERKIEKGEFDPDAILKKAAARN